MKRLLPWLSALVLLVTLAAWRLGRAEPFDESLFAKTLEQAPPAAPDSRKEGVELAGRVTTHEGRPAADAWVVLERPQPFESGPAPVRGEYTDTEGAFRFEDLAPGSYRVVLQHSSAPPRSFTTEVPAKGAVQWTLAEPQAPIEWMPALERGAVRGRVTLPAGLAAIGDLAGYEVVFTPVAETHPLAGAAQRRVACDGAGNFALADLVRVDYDVRVLPPWASGGSWPELARAPCRHRGAETELVLELAVGTLSGTLVEPPDTPLVGAVVRITSLSATDVLAKPQLWPPAVTDEAGRFRTGYFPAGRYRLHARAGDGVEDVEVNVQAGEHVEVPFAPMAPRTGQR